MGHLLYIVGEPGAGKSTLCAHLTDSCGGGALAVRPIKHLVWRGAEADVAELGFRRQGGFAGTDALQMNVQPLAVEFMQARMYGYVLAEGDRLANDGFFSACESAGWEVDVVYLSLPEGEGQRRREARAARLGVKEQNATWVAGRVTKASRLAERWATLRLDGTQPPEELVRSLLKQPVVQALRGG